MRGLQGTFPASLTKKTSKGRDAGGAVTKAALPCSSAWLQDPSAVWKENEAVPRPVVDGWRRGPRESMGPHLTTSAAGPVID